jgi:hypothetical protein
LLTEDEVKVAAHAYAVGAEGRSFTPHDEWLPACESLREKGWLSRRMVEGDVDYSLTPTGTTAMELNRLSGETVSTN